MKCPACGFETPDSQAWCDFCKEPFKKPTPKAPAAGTVPLPGEPIGNCPGSPSSPREGAAPGAFRSSEQEVRNEAPGAPAAPAPAAPAAPPEAKPSPEPAKAAAPAVPLDPAAVKNLPNEKLMELLKMDAAKDSIPETAPATRYLAWAFLAVVFLMMIVFSIVMLRKAQRGDLPGPRHEAAEPSGQEAPESLPAAPSETPPETPKQTL